MIHVLLLQCGTAQGRRDGATGGQHFGVRNKLRVGKAGDGRDAKAGHECGFEATRSRDQARRQAIVAAG